MLHGNLFHEAKVIRIAAAQAAGATDYTGATVVDTQGYEGVAFIVLFGTITAGAVTGIKVQQGQAANLSDAADLKGTALAIADTQSNKALITDIYKPAERYVKPIVTRATQNAVIDGIIAILYNARTAPVTHDAGIVGAEYFQTPDEGTA
jgi:hypothetical protein